MNILRRGGPRLPWSFETHVARAGHGFEADKTSTAADESLPRAVLRRCRPHEGAARAFGRNRNVQRRYEGLSRRRGIRDRAQLLPGISTSRRTRRCIAGDARERNRADRSGWPTSTVKKAGEPPILGCHAQIASGLKGSFMQFKSFETGVEVNGANVGAFVDAFKLFPSVILRCLVKHGIGTMAGKNVEIDRNRWYPQEAWLAAWEEIATSIGPRACYQIGRQVPRHAVFPPSVTDVSTAVASIDIAYHMNHRKNGKVMFDPATGQRQKGIGTYGYEPVRGERRIKSVCENPYP